MAYDYVSLMTGEDLRGNELLSPIGEFDTITGEVVSQITTSSHGGMKIIHGVNNDFIKNSIHKHHHGNNGVDFTFAEFVDAIIKLFEDLELNPYEVTARSFEFGINTVLPEDIPSTKFLRHCKTYLSEPINCKKFNKTKALFTDIKTDNYTLKLYQKGMQLKRGHDPNLLRAELKVDRMAICESIGITTSSSVADLLNPSKAFHLINLLLAKYDKVVFYDWTINPRDLTKPKRKIFNKWRDANYIEQLAQNNPRIYKYEHEVFNNIIAQYSELNVKERVRNQIKNKWSEIWQIDKKTCTKLHTFLSRYKKQNLYQITSSILGVKEYNILTPDAIEYLEQIQGVKRCIVTGGDIADQKAGSKFISAKKIGYYDAHNIRNTDSNPRNNLRRSIERIANDPSLFPIDSILTITDDQKKILEYWQGTQYDVLKNVGVSN